ncbi:hypothetical protein LOTGIDRAFT_238975 [Lottia gigantea]|uniref:Alpha-2-macroglobulin bait region domain-containing protein n=1 Tax=Lottia gigantea TaxID=225164 RepID=V4AUN6_LOTGI|nr:hypothetical protein LOTGIDRAFT_238975 [Lottia gigantea]ESO98655.1 hypothetical protein LOTGIDRAFT_238975 [Lottia gigantea]
MNGVLRRTHLILRRGYLLTFPVVLPAGSTEKFCMSLHGSDNFKSYTLTLTHQDTEIVEEFNLWTVQFRVLTMKRDLKPRIGQISQVFIKDSNDVRVKQWLDVQSEGLTSLDFQLAREPLLGVWKIEATIDGDLTTQTFKVDEYVLPKFEVTINPPKFLLSNSSTVEGEICAKYTYGKPVRGRLEAEICLGGHRSINAPCASIVEEIEGCYSFSVNATDVGFRKGYYFYRAELKISAEVWEAETGVMVKESHKGPRISFDPLKITLKDDSNKFFKPSFPYHGRAEVTKPDGSVAPGEIIEITMINYKYDIRLSKNFTSDKNGIIKFSSCHQPLSFNMAEFSVQARAVEYTDEGGVPTFRLYMPRAYSTIKQWFSPSKSFIQIPQINHTVKCGEEVTLDIPYTTTLDSYTLFHYQVMSRGKMLHTGHKEHHFLKHDKTQMLDVPQEECLILEVENRVPTSPPTPTTTVHVDPTHTTSTFARPSPPTPPTPGLEKLIEEPFQPELFEPLNEPLGMPFEPLNSPIRKKRYIMPPNQEEKIEISENPSTHISHVKIKFVVTPDMAPHAKLLVYYIREDGETVADSISFNVEKCFRNKVSMEFNNDQVLPGAETIIKVEASPGSLCSIGVVDKSINILGGDHQLTPEKLLAAIEDLDLSKYNNLYNDNDYCERKRKTEKEASEGESMEMADSLYGWYYYSSKYVDSIQAFKKMGLRVMTNLQVESRPCSYSHPVVYDSVPMPLSGGIARQFLPTSRRVPNSATQRNVVINNKNVIRNYFPETWLWSLEKIG